MAELGDEFAGAAYGGDRRDRDGDGGNDHLQGNKGDDHITGSLNGKNLIRGGQNEDTLIGGHQRDMLIGDLDKDQLTGKGGSDFFVLRCDTAKEGNNGGDRDPSPGQGGGFGFNISPNLDEVDVITDFNNAEDYIILPGVMELQDIWFEAEGASDTVIMVWHEGEAMAAGLLQGVSPSGVNATRIIIGDLAGQMLASTGPDHYRDNPGLLDSFGL